MAKKEKMVHGVFRSRVDADRAFDRLLGMGYLESEVNVLMSDTTRANYYATAAGSKTKESKHHAGSMATEGMAAGGAIGTVVGAAGAAIATALVGVSLALPGGAIIAGPLAAALAAAAGGGAGAVTGGLLGALIGFGIPEQNAKAYEEILRDGGVALGVVPHSSDDAREIERIFKDHNGENVCVC